MPFFLAAATVTAIAIACTCGSTGEAVIIIERDPAPSTSDFLLPRASSEEPAPVACWLPPRELRAPNPPRRAPWHVQLRSFS